MQRKSIKIIMESDDFEVLMQMKIHDLALSNDIILVIVFILLSVFAWVFRLNVPLFGKMISHITSGEQRQSIFETTEKDSILFNAFMVFQTILLCSIFVFSVAFKYDIIQPEIVNIFLSIGFLFLLFLVFFLFKIVLYTTLGTFFIAKSTNKMLITNYQALFCTWGVTLYLPVFGVLLFDSYLFVSFIFLIISYLIFKVIFSFRFFYIFYNKNTGFLFLSLYLCAQEIVPLVFLYEGMVYTYNIMK